MMAKFIKVTPTVVINVEHISEVYMDNSLGDFTVGIVLVGRDPDIFTTEFEKEFDCIAYFNKVLSMLSEVAELEDYSVQLGEGRG
jgi:hypothetical protein